jgi:hypothetical protein
MPDARALAAAYGVRVELADLGDWGWADLVAEYDPDGPVIRVNTRGLRHILRRAQDDMLLARGRSIIPSGDDVIVNGDDVIVNGDDVIVNGDDVILSGDDVILSGDDGILSGDDGILSGDDVILSLSKDEPTRSFVNRAIAHELYHHREAIGEIPRIASGKAREAAADAFSDALTQAPDGTHAERPRTTGSFG